MGAASSVNKGSGDGPIVRENGTTLFQVVIWTPDLAKVRAKVTPGRTNLVSILTHLCCSIRAENVVRSSRSECLRHQSSGTRRQTSDKGHSDESYSFLVTGVEVDRISVY